MLHVATVHYASPRWVEIQTSHLRRHISVPFTTWTSLEKIDPAYGAHFDRVLEQRGLHAAKLNHLAMEICHEADPGDLIMFLDGDAFPIADPMPLLERGLAEAPLVAVRRAENANEPQPHPCFCVTSVATWLSLPGDWCAGRTWIGPRGRPTSDVGGNLLRRLELDQTPWVEVLRSNRHDLDPLYFAVYGDAVYHHGAGFRIGELSPAHLAGSPSPLARPGVPGADQAVRLVNRLRFQRWQRRLVAGQVRRSQELYRQIAAGEDGWLAQLR
jgi:hypothetical protein